MATHDININAKVNNSVTQQTASQASQAMQRFTKNTQNGAAVVRTFYMAVNGSVKSQFGMINMLGKMTGAGGVLALMYIAFKQVNNAAKELADRFTDMKDVLNGNYRDRQVEESNRIADKKNIFQDEGERETLKAQLAEQRLQDLRATRDRLVKEYASQKDAPLGIGSLAWEKTKGVFTDNYFDRKAQLKEQLDEVTRQIQNEEAIKNAAKRASEKYWRQVGDGMLKQIESSPEYLELQKLFKHGANFDEQQGQWKLYQSEAPVWLQDELDNVGKRQNMGVETQNWSSFINAMDKIGGYMSNFTASIGKDRQLDEMKKQTTKLDQIANNTKNINTKARYA